MYWSGMHRNPELTTTKRARLPATVFAFPRERKLPLPDASHVRNAMARFGQVKDVSSGERRRAYRTILRAATRYGIDDSGFIDRWGGRYG
jgi:hypothetical protein